MPIASLRAWMENERVDAACLTRPVTIGYLTGFHTDPHERLMALALTDGRARLLVPALERENAERAAGEVEVVSWRDGEDAFAVLRQLLAGNRRLAVEKAALTVLAAEQLQAGELVDIGPEVNRLRSIKSEAELGALQRAAELTDRAMVESLAAVKLGQSELEIAALVDAAIVRAGSSPAFATAAQSGPNSARPHLTPTGRRASAGDLLLLDLGATAGRYRGDITRMAAFGEPGARQLELHEIVLEAHDAAIAAVRAGIPAREVDRAARQVIEAAGHGAEFIHRTGHGLGLEVHEDPGLTATNEDLLEPGMVVTIEPGIYIPGWGGIRIEDDVVVEEKGGRVLTAAPRELYAIA